MVSLRNIAPLPDSDELILSNMSNDTVTNVETNDDTLAKENNKETDPEMVTKKNLMLKWLQKVPVLIRKMSKMKLYLYSIPFQ